jgi:hypothetical protein
MITACAFAPAAGQALCRLRSSRTARTRNLAAA